MTDREQFVDVPRDPEGSPETVTHGVEIYSFPDIDDRVIRDLYLVERGDRPAFQMWQFKEISSGIVFGLWARHRYGTDEPTRPRDPPCCFKKSANHGLERDDCPEHIEEILTGYAGKQVVYP